MKRNGRLYWLCQGSTWTAMLSYWAHHHGTLAVSMLALSIIMLAFGAVNAYRADKEQRRRWYR